MNRIRQLTARADAWLGAREPRERLLILLTALVLVYAVGSLLLLEPLERDRRAVSAALDAATERLARLEAEATAASRRLAEGPDAGLRRRALRLEEEIAALEARLLAHRAALVSPEEMARVLEELVGREANLRLLRLETLASEPVIEPVQTDPAATAAPPAALFRHAFVIEAEGNYFATLRYLHAVEALPWRVHLDQLDYEVTEYPTARLRLELHTLSAAEAWIGV